MRNLEDCIIVGIDPGVTTGVALLLKPSNELKLDQFDAHFKAILFINLLIEEAKAYEDGEVPVKLIIEDARKNKKNAFLAKRDGAERMQSVGYVKGYSKDWEAFAKYKGVEYELRQPQSTACKNNPDLFEKITGLKTLKTQSHMRDAAMLVHGL